MPLSLAVNRLKKRLTLKRNNVPKQAFAIMGHGSERAGYKTVPKGCILIVLARSGNVEYNADYLSHMIAALDYKRRTQILDPIQYKTELFRLFGPLTIFTEGDLYPDFRYNLFSYGGSDRSSISASGIVPIGAENTRNDLLLLNSVINDYVAVSGKGSPLKLHAEAVARRDIGEDVLNTPMFLVEGVVPVLSTWGSSGSSSSSSSRAFEHVFTQLNPDAEAKLKALNIPDFFKFSIGPVSQAEVAATIGRYLTEYRRVTLRPVINDLTIRDFLNNLFKYDFAFSQERLFSTFGPGVYLNFVCRKIGGDLPVPRFLRLNKVRRIEEAETHRKAIIRNAIR